MSAGRLLSVLLLLQSRGRMSAREVAAELGVSVRTAYRDLARLQAAGVPVYAETGRSGGYQLLDGYRTRLTGMSQGEARALFLAGLPGPAADLGLAAEVAAARLKLLAALPAGLREEAARTAAVFHLDAPAWYREPEQAPHLTLFADAVLTRRVVDVRYRRWRAPQEVQRRLRPYGLVLKSGTWYLVAATESRIATYRVTQVLDAVLSDERFDRPPDFDLGAYWTTYLADFQSRRYTGTATIHLSRQGRRRLPDNVPPEVVRAVEATATAVGDDGWVEAVIPTESTAHACGELLRLGIDVKVIAPAELHRAMADTVGVLARAYGSDCPAPGPTSGSGSGSG
ncbi:helix-turn-helix transcriptional regulator [Streptomyces zagrosensis]|uniref:Putative DNA-binding transcriptional regulator YafY n=1 Tax=Streptomyces zagrosensis TaxID=1042984 RepID=A0A7W9Q3W6_9ACTN|nr:WYL domain-containing protein [Streptomyces zagrosensis]MBB5933055.1 putative DNA-binding transcriptional regulator YafY [Streptomyces zagrosensis]